MLLLNIKKFAKKSFKAKEKLLTLQHIELFKLKKSQNLKKLSKERKRKIKKYKIRHKNKKKEKKFQNGSCKAMLYVLA
jgi:hypothetical protein